ncbi:MAG: hypothetical protein IPI64_13405 [Chloracidobacterium sp.]|nr:hypothetical protein [Chloracidobacterium sp.]
MKNKYSILLLITLLFSATAFAAGKPTETLAVDAVSNDTATSLPAIRELRAMGSVGLDALFTRYAADIDRFVKTGNATADWKRIAAALDTVAMQKDAYTAHLYWYTDLEAAKVAAKAKNKPILTLRLLGNLNEEFSCANSRLFRAILYSNAGVSKYLRDNYILHWKSVRPAPRITIDFGDGRKIERTITGNSIHYVIDANGSVIDAIPGLYNPATFLKYITKSNEINKSVQQLPLAEQNRALLKYRKDGFEAIVAERKKTIETAGVQMTETKTGSLAILAAPIAVAKMIVVDEYSILRVYDDFAKFEQSVNYDDWNKLASVYSANNALDANSIAMIRRQNAKTGLSEAEFKGLFAKLNSFLALDTTRNDFLFHTKLYEWLNRDRPGDLESLNAQVYDKIFQTPNSDKWLGLYSTDVYTALDGNGIIK